MTQTWQDLKKENDRILVLTFPLCILTRQLHNTILFLATGSSFTRLFGSQRMVSKMLLKIFTVFLARNGSQVNLYQRLLFCKKSIQFLTIYPAGFSLVVYIIGAH